MTDLGPVPWPPAPIRTERLVLRAAEARDRAAFVELYASQEVHTYLGGARPREELAREMPAVPGQWPGSFVVALDGVMTGQVLLRRATEHSRPAAVGKVDLDWLGGVLPDEPVILATQTANTRSLRLAAKLGFTEVERFRAWEAEQWLGLRPAASA
ncbi:GNAT family N-acetyltransferase [Streptomyces griseoincarnatus]